MKESEKLLNKIIERITLSVNHTSRNKLQLAYDLHWANNVIVWKLTEYRSWAGFCRTHVLLCPAAIYRLIQVINKIEKLGYSADD